MSETVQEFISGLVNLVEEINRLPNHAERAVLEGYGFRLEEALNRLRWFSSVISEPLLDEAKFRT